ncbi:MAG: hypothetical protein ABIC36_03335 [bacterium]
MTKEILEQLFDSPLKVRLLKLFLRNPSQFFEFKEIAKRTKGDTDSCRQQIRKLESIKFINSKIKNKKKSYSINRDFDFYNELRILVLKSSPASKNKILKRIRAIGRISLAVLSGIFVDSDNSRVDILIVGDGIKANKLSVFLRDLEAEVGKEIDYVTMTTKDFKYRHDMFDRFLRDVLEKKHEKLINKLKI